MLMGAGNGFVLIGRSLQTFIYDAWLFSVGMFDPNLSSALLIGGEQIINTHHHADCERDQEKTPDLGAGQFAICHQPSLGVFAEH